MKNSKHFELAIPHVIVKNEYGIKRRVCIGEYEISAVATSWDDDEEPFTYDVSEIFYREKNGSLHKLPIYALEGLGVEVKEMDFLHDAIMAHIPSLFRDEQDPKDADEDPTDTIEFNNPFAAIATITRGYNNTLIVNPTKPAA